ncbi:MAG: hypothetical protein EOM51_10305 [Clostridia bacterium]|nr:hypothetical protein [Clostridia bacterium]
MTWGSLKSQIQNLGFAAESEMSQYSQSLIEASNYAMLEVATEIDPLVKKIAVSQYNPENLLTNQSNGYLLSDEPSFIAQSPAAYCFECDGTGTAYIKKDGTTLTTIPLSTTERAFKIYRGFITETGEITLEFTSNYLGIVRHIALYERVYGAALNDIPPLGEYTRHDIIALTAGIANGTFMSFTGKVQREADGETDEYADYLIEEHGIIAFKRDEEGQFIVFYNAYPDEITAQTTDNYALPIKPEAAKLIPLLAASRIWQDDDATKSAVYYNQYQIAKEAYTKIKKPNKTATWQNTKGYY